MKLALSGSEYKEITDHVSDKEMIWAISVLLERGMEVKGKWILAPYLDIMNSALQWNPEAKRYNDINNIELDSAGNLKHLVNSGYKKGDQLLISYSLKMGTPDYFIRYGFVTENNMNDFITLKVNPVDSYGPRKQILEELDDQNYNYVSVSDIGLSDSFLRYVYVSLATQEELEKFEGSLTAPQKRIAKVWALNSIINFAKKWETPLESDTKALSDNKAVSKMTMRERMALKFRVASKKLVIRIINALNNTNSKNTMNDSRKNGMTPTFEIEVQRNSDSK